MVVDTVSPLTCSHGYMVYHVSCHISASLICLLLSISLTITS